MTDETRASPPAANSEPAVSVEMPQMSESIRRQFILGVGHLLRLDRAHIRAGAVELAEDLTRPPDVPPS